MANLAAARTRLTLARFTVAPDARHPFGTENACVFLKDGTYLEPLAIGSEADSLASARAGNVFTARDRAFRSVMDRKDLRRSSSRRRTLRPIITPMSKPAFRAGRMLDFFAPLPTPRRAESVASFRLAFAADLRSPDFYAFTCQRINTPAVDRSALMAHENGVTGVAGVTLCEPHPHDFANFIGVVSRGGQPEQIGDNLEMQAAAQVSRW